jgi:hypothetical protein
MLIVLVKKSKCPCWQTVDIPAQRGKQKVLTLPFSTQSMASYISGTERGKIV